jgi:hypothetical protein
MTTTIWKVTAVIGLTNIHRDFYVETRRSLEMLLEPTIQQEFGFTVQGWSVQHVQPYNGILAEIGAVRKQSPISGNWTGL